MRRDIESVVGPIYASLMWMNELLLAFAGSTGDIIAKTGMSVCFIISDEIIHSQSVKMTGLIFIGELNHFLKGVIINLTMTMIKVSIDESR